MRGPVGIWVELAEEEEEEEAVVVVRALARVSSWGPPGRRSAGREGDSRWARAKLGEEIKDDGESFLDQIQVRENGNG